MDWTPLFNMGGVACVLVWFMLRAEPRFKRIEEAVDRSSRSILLMLVAHPDTNKAVKAEAEKIIEELNEAARSRGSSSKKAILE